MIDNEKNKEEIKIGRKDILAAIIAEFEILFPLALGGILIFTLVLLFIGNVWFRN